MKNKDQVREWVKTNGNPDFFEENKELSNLEVVWEIRRLIAQKYGLGLATPPNEFEICHDPIYCGKNYVCNYTTQTYNYRSNTIKRRFTEIEEKVKLPISVIENKVTCDTCEESVSKFVFRCVFDVCGNEIKVDFE